MSLLVAAADKVKEKLEANKTALHLGAIFYGDQAKLPARFNACVEPDSDKAELQGQGMHRRVKRVVTIYVLLYDTAIQSTENNRRESDEKAEEIEALLNSDATLGGLFTHCYVTAVESGYDRKEGTLVRANRITLQCTLHSDPLPMMS